eukprot:4074697-Pyramimonas_sp.AAC.1
MVIGGAGEEKRRGNGEKKATGYTVYLNSSSRTTNALVKLSFRTDTPSILERNGTGVVSAALFAGSLISNLDSRVISGNDQKRGREKGARSEARRTILILLSGAFSAACPP